MRIDLYTLTNRFDFVGYLMITSLRMFIRYFRLTLMGLSFTALSYSFRFIGACHLGFIILLSYDYHCILIV